MTGLWSSTSAKNMTTKLQGLLYVPKSPSTPTPCPELSLPSIGERLSHLRARAAYSCGLGVKLV